MTTLSIPTGLDWQLGIARALVRAGVTVAAFVPDSRLSGILQELAEQGVSLRSLTREEECVGYACGQRVGGGRPVVLMQSSGLGNALNALGTLAIPYRLGLPLIVSMRGTLGEKNPSQIPIGRAAPALLAALGIQNFALRAADRADPVVTGVVDMAYHAGETAAVLLEPELGGGRS